MTKCWKKAVRVQIPPPAPYIFCEERFIGKWVLSIFLFFYKEDSSDKTKRVDKLTISIDVSICMIDYIVVYQ